MTLDELKATLKSAKLHPIVIEESASDDDEGPTLAGTLDEYLEALHALEVSAVFITTAELHERHFFYEPEFEEGEDLDAEEEPVDLSKLESRLARYKKNVGTIGWYRLTAYAAHCQLSFDVYEDWWKEVVVLAAGAAQSWQAKRFADAEQVETTKREKDRLALASLKRLLNDSQFVRLPNQKAMLFYAREHIEGLESVDDGTLKAEIQELRAEIAAKGIGKRS